MKKKNKFIRKSIPLLAILSSTLLLTSCNKNKGDDWGIINEEGTELLEKLHYEVIMRHTKYITYGSYMGYVAPGRDGGSIDADPNNLGQFVDFYTGMRYSSASSGISREHVWACGNSSNMWSHDKNAGIHYVDNPDYKGGGSDLFHIRPVNTEVNTRRGNAKIYVFKENEECYEYPNFETPYKIKTEAESAFSSKFEPADEIKGDIVRILMYVYTHYTNIGDNSDFPERVQGYLGSLNLANVFHSSYSTEDIHRLMVEWNEKDPVDDIEKHRNEVIKGIQGNTNPFVDHPEYMKKIFFPDDE